jgi:hypothetical protein
MTWWNSIILSAMRPGGSRGASPIVLDSAPGPTPWHVRRAGSLVPGFTWTDAGPSSAAAGIVVLAGPHGPVLILDFHNYVLSIDPETLLVWHQRHEAHAPATAPVVLRTFGLRTLQPLRGDLKTLCADMRRGRAPFLSAAPPACEFPLPTTIVDERQHVTFPGALRAIPELLILCHSSAIHSRGDFDNLALMVASPRKGWYELFPQDWFNNGGFDYEYQWVKRVARDPRTGRIHGDGTRIDPFVLDETLRQLA